jgi:hypothetical protein
LFLNLVFAVDYGLAVILSTANDLLQAPQAVSVFCTSHLAFGFAFEFRF